MRIAVVNPPIPRGKLTNRDLMGGMGIDDDFGVGLGPRFVALLKNEGTRLPVLSLAYAAAIFRAAHEVRVFELGRVDPDDATALDRIARYAPDWIVAATSFAFLGTELRFLERVRSVTGARRLVLGYAATHFAREILERGLAEAVSHGDPEVACRSLAEEVSPIGKPGALWLDHGAVVDGACVFLDDLDALPHPAWDLFDLSDYGYFPLLKKRPFATMLSSRGCPYGCGFCPYPIAQGAPFRPRSPASVVHEMKELVERHGVRAVLFRDPTFSLDMDRVRAICEGALRERIEIDWGIETRLDRLDPPTIELLARAGCRSAEFGVDPIDEHTRKASHRRGIAPERAAAMIRCLEANGIASAGLFVIGIPEMTGDEMNRTIEWIESLDLSYVNYEVATPFPGTPMYSSALARGWIAPLRLDDLLAGDPKLAFNGAIDRDEIRALQDRALRRFYFRPRRIAREVLNGNVIENVRFVTASGLRFLRRAAGVA